ncbi:MAG: filamentous hemagglutinin family protein [Chthoniobacteraceae bacterium]
MNEHHTQLPNPVIRARGLARGRRSGRCLFRFSAALGVCVTLAATVTAYGRDILRPGGGAIPSAQGIATGASSGAVATQARANALDAMARTTRAIQSVQAMQTAARSAAIAGPNNLGANPNNPALQLPNVPNGLGAGGLEVAAGATAGSNLWQGAKLPVQSVSAGQTTVKVTQTSQQAVLNWKSFNVGKQTTLNFDQSAGGANAGQWIAFNKISDPSGVPSQILGSITAQGQVYVINQNGIIFGGSSQVNTHALVASSLPINDNLIDRGLLNNPDSQFLFSSLKVNAGKNGTPAFTPPAAPNGKSGDVVVQPGAQIAAPTSAEHVGGRVALIGPNVSNGGTISTPDGQTILAAGEQVGMAAHASSDPTLRGLDVFIGATTASSGTATHSGLINAASANVTMAGKTVNQNGVIDSTTSVSLNGRVDLLANYNAVVISPLTGNLFFNPTASGTVSLGAGSVVQIQPDVRSTDTVVGVRLALPSMVNIQGGNVYLGTNAAIVAPNASVPSDNPARDATGASLTSGISLAAGKWLAAGINYQLSQTSGQIYLDTNALITAAGSTDVSVPIAKNILSVELRGTELADSPVQRSGALRGSTVRVDIRQNGTYNGFNWIGTPIANVSGYANLIQRSVSELTTAGGSISIKAGSSVVMQAGSLVDVSGGWTNYQGGMVQTSKVLSGGHVYDISQATPDRVYDGIYTGSFTETHAKWGVQNTYTSPLSLNAAHYEAGYVWGANGGSILINAPSMALDGVLLGTTVNGPRQRNSAALVQLSALAINFVAQDASVPANAYPRYSPDPPQIIFQPAAMQAAAEPFSLDSSGNSLPLRADRRATVILQPDLVSGNGFGTLSIDNSDGSIVVPANVVLSAPAKGSITLRTANLDVEGRISAPGGSLNFSIYNISPYLNRAVTGGIVPPTPAPNVGRGQFTLGSVGSLSTAGLLVDDRLGISTALTLPLVIDGGLDDGKGGKSGVTISSYGVALLPGSLVDASGGAIVSATGKRTYGVGGSITIKAGEDPNFAVLGGGFTAAGMFRSLSGSKGGALALQAASVQIGGTASHPGTLLLGADFFSAGGFSSYSITGLGEVIPGQVDDFVPGVLIAPGTAISAVAQNYVAGFGRSGINLIPVIFPDALRTPVSLTFRAPGVRDPGTSRVNPLVVRGDIVMSEGSSIQTDPKGSVSLTGDTVAVMGSIIAPGGSISIKGGNSFPFPDVRDKTVALATVDIGPRALLNVAGTTVFTPNPRGYRTGSVLPGGTISVAGNIVAEAGGILDVSGATDVLLLSPLSSGLNNPLAGALTGVPVSQAIYGSTAPFRGSFSGISIPSKNGSLTGTPYVVTRVDSDGGSIVFTGAEELFLDSTLIGRAGGSSANKAGSLSVSSGRYAQIGEVTTPKDITLNVRQSGPILSTRLYAAGKSAIGQAVADPDGNPVQAFGHFTVDRFAAGGFDTLNLGVDYAAQGAVQFTGPVSIHANRSLTIAKGDASVRSSGGFIFADSAVSLSAPYVAVGRPFQAPLSVLEQQTKIGEFTDSRGNTFYAAPQNGAGSITFSGGLIDIGNLSLQNIGKANFIADNGDIRGNGTLDVAGDIYFRAGQIYPPTAVAFNIVAYDYSAGGVTKQGSVKIEASGTRQLPLSAGGELNIFGANIAQNGTVRAPIGKITIGWDGTGATPKDFISGAGFDFGAVTQISKTRQLTLGSSGVTSVSAVDPDTGKGIVIPYGIVLDGTKWIDPHGTDITASGVVEKSVRISAVSVTTMAGSSIDVRGGGDLFAYHWVPGTGGSQDVLSSATSFAIIPGYGANYAPYAPFTSTTSNFTYYNPTTGTNATDAGYVSVSTTKAALAVGDQVYLGATGGLGAGTYTLLPARYALLPGAFLVTPQSSNPVGTYVLPEGSSIVSGYRFNSLGQTAGTPQFTRLEIASSSVVANRSRYESFLAGDFLAKGAINNNASVPRLPKDAGYLLLSATQAMKLDGAVFARGSAGGRAGLVDISSPVDIIITAPGTPEQAGKLTLDATKLNAFGAESLLIGGSRGATVDGVTPVTVRTSNLTVSNAGAPLSGPEIVLVANQKLSVEPGAQILQSGVLSDTAQNLRISGLLSLDTPGASFTFGSGGGPIGFPNGTPSGERITFTPPAGSTVKAVLTKADGSTTTFTANAPLTIAAGSTLTLPEGGKLTFANFAGTPLAIPFTVAEGVLLRVSSDPTAQSNRPPFTKVATNPLLEIQSGARIAGTSVTLDSTSAMTLDPTAVLAAQSLRFASGKMSIVLGTGTPLQPNAGLVFAGSALPSLTGARSLSLLSYSNIDVYGAGTFSVAGSLAIRTGELRGIQSSAGVATFSAKSILFDNFPNAIAPAAPSVGPGSLKITAETVKVGINKIVFSGYADAEIIALTGVQLQGNGGLITPGDLTVTAPAIIATQAAEQSLVAGGDLNLTGTAGTTNFAGGLSARVSLVGRNVTASSAITLPSGVLSIRATAGDLAIGGRLDLGGISKSFYDVQRFTDGGQVSLTADHGNVTFGATSLISVAASPAGGNAGSVSISAPEGVFALTNGSTFVGGAGNAGIAGTFSLDAKRIPGTGSASSVATLDTTLNAGGFTESRSYRIRSGDVLVDNAAAVNSAIAHSYSLSADGGSITVTGKIDASGPRGGSISLVANGDVILRDSSILTVAAQDFNAAGKGGSVFLGAGSAVLNGGTYTAGTGQVDIQTGSTIDLSVLSIANAAAPSAATLSAAALGKYSGTLELRAPQIAGPELIGVKPINGKILNASRIVVQGFEVFISPDETIDSLTPLVQDSGANFAGGYDSTGTLQTGSAAAIMSRLLASNPGLASVLHIRPGAEIVNPNGDLSLINSWDLSSVRFGPGNDEPGILTLRAKGNLNFNFHASLNDGFGLDFAADPLFGESWTYRMSAGADFGAVDFHRVLPLSGLGAASGSLVLGSDPGSFATLPTAKNNDRQSILPDYFQTIRTGTGDIDIVAGRDVVLLNPLATIYTSGTIADPIANFDVPNIEYSDPRVGARQDPLYFANYTVHGGDVTIRAQNDIARYNVDASGKLIADSSKELPNNWLYRRGYRDPVTGQFVPGAFGDIGSTTWWIDFSNFFEGVGALGGGNLTMIAGRNISNVDALVPTNARLPYTAADVSALVELGGGDLTVHAGGNIDAGVYYVERGTGSLSAGGSITTNATRAAVKQSQFNNPNLANAGTWLPTTLFLGKGSFDVMAGGDLLLGPVANPFLLPQGINSSYWNKSYFSTYSLSNSVSVTSLGGTITLKDSASGGAGSLASWFQNVQLFGPLNPGNFSESQPWLRLAETSTAPFSTVSALMPSSLAVTAFSGDLNLIGSLTLSPSPSGTVNFAIAGAINGVQENGFDFFTGNRLWASSRINLSDADPADIPGVFSPLSLALPINSPSWAATPGNLTDRINALFDESGSTAGSRGANEAKRALHAGGPLHAGDNEPVRIYAVGGDISGVTLFTGKAARVLAANDITDVALFIQNTASTDLSVVGAGRDIVAFNPNSVLRQQAKSPGNILPSSDQAVSGDIQISGPGTLEVLAGRNLTLGSGRNANDPADLDAGISSIGNQRNPALPFVGAGIIIGAGVGGPATLGASALDLTTFNSQFLTQPNLERYLPEVDIIPGLTPANFTSLSQEDKARVALEVFYRVLRDSGRDRNNSASPYFGTYTIGFSAVEALFPRNRTWQGDIAFNSRSIRTTSGGGINFFAPGGGLTLGTEVKTPPPGIVTESGGNVSIFTRDSVEIGVQRIFTLRGGNEIIWSSTGDIAAGASSKTVQTAPPTRVSIDPQSADVKTDLAGLATGGGIGVLATVAGIAAGNVDLIAPGGAIDAGDAGIRSTGKLNVAAIVILNASNISASGGSVGTPSATVSAPNIGGVTAGNAATASASTARDEITRQTSQGSTPSPEEPQSIFTIEILGYGGSDQEKEKDRSRGAD